MGGKPRKKPEPKDPRDERFERDFEGKTYENFALYFQMQANALAMKYGGPVYLVGGALTQENPRDYDIRIVITNQDCTRLFGEREPTRHITDFWSEAEWRQRSEGLKQSRLLYSRVNYRLDVQIQNEDEASRYKDEARIRLDSATDYHLNWRTPT